jgi:hypothetical protein
MKITNPVPNGHFLLLIFIANHAIFIRADEPATTAPSTTTTETGKDHFSFGTRKISFVSSADELQPFHTVAV